ncbi:MAG: HD-GYP domain-containing protein [Gemmatimonadaceae bacterium]
MRGIGNYVGIVFLAAVAAASAAYVAWPGLDPSAVRAAICFAILGTFASFIAFQLARGAIGSIAYIPVLTIAVLTASWIAIVAAAASTLVVQLLARRPAIKVAFNVAQYSFSVAIAVIVYRLLGGAPLLRSEEYAVLPYVAMFAAFIVANTTAVSAAVAISEGRRVGDVWRENTLGTIIYDVFSLPLVYIFAWTYLAYDVIGAVVLSLPLLGVRQLYKTNADLQKINQDLLQLMVAAIEARDPYTSGHSRRVSEYAKIIARARGLRARQVERIGVAALLHDVGKIHEIYAPILRKPARLTSDETRVIQTHPIKSAELVQNVDQLKDVVGPIRYHHENWDGSGYPEGLAGERIPLAARIIMIADTIDAMTSDRPYRAALGEAEVRRELVRYAGKQFDPELCRLLLLSPHFSRLFHPVPLPSQPAFGPAFGATVRRRAESNRA